MKVEMPTMPKQPYPTFDSCELFLARAGGGEVIETVLRGENEVIYFTSNHGILYSSRAYFDENYELIRAYRPGEQLIITA